MTSPAISVETPKLFAVAHEPGARKPYIVRTTEQEYAYARKIGSSKKIMELIEAGYKLDQTGQTRPIIPAEGKHVVFDPETRDYLLYLDGQFVGAARTEHEGDTTLDTLVDEIARHTRAESADMAAETAEAVLEPLNCRVEPAPVTSPRTVSELRNELERVTDAIHARKAVGAGYANLHAMRVQIIAELDAAHKIEDAAPSARVPESITPTHCPACGDPSDGLCAACRESGETVPAFSACPACERADCPGVRNIQRCSGVRAILFATPPVEHPFALVARPAQDDPCAAVRARLDEALSLLAAVEALIDACGTVDTETHEQVRAFLRA